MLNGSTTQAVWDWLNAQHRIAWWTRAQIIAATGCQRTAVNWALTYLRHTGRLEVNADSRCIRYLRYRAVRESGRVDARAASRM